MGHWLAPPGAARQIGFAKRFDARLWSVNFPRPMMASVVTTGPCAALPAASRWPISKTASQLPMSDQRKWPSTTAARPVFSISA